MSAFRRVQPVRVTRMAGIAVLRSALVLTSCTKSEDTGNESAPGTGTAARAKDIPVLTIDRKVNAEPCT